MYAKETYVCKRDVFERPVLEFNRNGRDTYTYIGLLCPCARDLYKIYTTFMCKKDLYKRERASKQESDSACARAYTHNGCD